MVLRSDCYLVYGRQKGLQFGIIGASYNELFRHAESFWSSHFPKSVQIILSLIFLRSGSESRLIEVCHDCFIWEDGLFIMYIRVERNSSYSVDELQDYTQIESLLFYYLGGSRPRSLLITLM
jgi:hypothetical protein